MTRVFVDTLYWIAAINPKDQWHDKALEIGYALTSTAGVREVAKVLMQTVFARRARQGAAVALKDLL